MGTQSLITIIGTGFGGLCMAIRLKQAGIHDFVMLKKAGGVGGTWRDNTYPGAACDAQFLVPPYLGQEYEQRAGLHLPLSPADTPGQSAGL